MTRVLCAEDSDVSLIRVNKMVNGNVANVIECSGCCFTPETVEEDNPSFLFRKHAEEHLKTHLYAGHKVPIYAFRNIRTDTWLRA